MIINLASKYTFLQRLAQNRETLNETKINQIVSLKKSIFKFTQKLDESVYEEEGPQRAKKLNSPQNSGDSTPTGPGSRKTSQPAIKLDIIDESGGKNSN